MSYFYVIKEVETGRYYAGSKWKEGSSIQDFWKPGGYFTSSKVIKHIVDKKGPDAFQVVVLREMNNPYEYESRFLQKVKASSNDMFINISENKKMHSSFYEESGQRQQASRVKALQVSYGPGLTSYMQVDEIKEKSRKNWVEAVQRKYGVDHTLKVPEINAKAQASKKKTLQERYGVSHNFSIPEALENMKKLQDSRRIRPIVKQIQKYKDTYKLKFGTSWNLRTDDKLEVLLKDLHAILGDL